MHLSFDELKKRRDEREKEKLEKSNERLAVKSRFFITFSDSESEGLKEKVEVKRIFLSIFF